MKCKTYCLNKKEEAQLVVQELKTELTAEQEDFMIESQIEQARLLK